MKIYCVCGSCGEHATDEATIELNFRESCIYFVCPKCRKEQKILLKPASERLPKIRRM